jgi:hypothetical protein
MAVLVTVEVPGQTRQGCDGMRAMLEGSLKQARGLELHTSHPVEGGWRALEVWESCKDANDCFATAVHPNLSPGIKPRRTLQELHSLITP